MNRVLIVGIGGFSGLHMQKFLLENNLYNQYEIFGVGLKENCISSFVKYNKLDVTIDKDIREYLLKYQPNYIINFCGNFSVPEFETMKKINYISTKNIINAILHEKISIKKILLIGSAAEYGNVKNLPIKEDHQLNPISNYGVTKKMQTDFAMEVFKKTRLPVVVARRFNLIGEGISEDLIYGKYLNLIKNIEDEAEIDLINSDYIRDFVEIDYAIKIYWNLLIKGSPGEVYNICSGEGKKIKDIVELIIKNSGKKIKINNSNKNSLVGEIIKSVGDNSKISDLMTNIQ